MKKIICPYCDSEATLVDASVVYRRPGFGMVYVCARFPTCDSYVGVHQDTNKPKGSLANFELRDLRKQVHSVFDALWMGNPKVDRTEVYAAAAQVLGTPDFHIGDMREKDAEDFLKNSVSLLDAVSLVVQRRRLSLLADKGTENLIVVLRHLYVDSQSRATQVLSQSRYRGHTVSFNAGIAAGLVKRITKHETKKVFYVLTAAGCSAIGVSPS